LRDALHYHIIITPSSRIPTQKHIKYFYLFSMGGIKRREIKDAILDPINNLYDQIGVEGKERVL
jgi:hypothetical protein